MGIAIVPLERLLSARVSRRPTRRIIRRGRRHQRPGSPDSAVVAATESRLPGGRYGLVLLALVVSYLVTAFLTGAIAAALSTALYTLTLVLALRTSGLHRDASRAVRLALLVGTVMAVALLSAHTAVTDGLADVWFAILLLTTIAIVVRRVLADAVVSLQTVMGALSAYMMIGLMYAAIYASLDHFMTEPLFAGGGGVNANTVQYFSFTTLTTLGYGDFVAAGNAGRAIAMLEALTGQIFLATFVARLVASYIPRRDPPSDQEKELERA